MDKIDKAYKQYKKGNTTKAIKILNNCYINEILNKKCNDDLNAFINNVINERI